MAEQAVVDPTTPTDPTTTDPEPEPTQDPTPSESKHWSREESLGFDSNTIGWLENKGFENPQAAITSQRELETKLGGPPEMLQKWPEVDDSEGFEGIYRRLGKPENAEGYKIEFGEDVQVDGDTLSWFKGVALEHNMTNAQVQGMALAWNDESARVQKEQQQALEVQNQTEETALRIAWGTKYDERLDYGHRALLAHGLEESDIDQMQSALGSKKLAEYAAKIADTMGEDTIASNTTTPAFGTSKEQVQSSIDKLMGELKADDERYKRFYADHSAPKETTGKDYRRMEQLWTQLEGLGKV